MEQAERKHRTRNRDGCRHDHRYPDRERRAYRRKRHGKRCGDNQDEPPRVALAPQGSDGLVDRMQLLHTLHASRAEFGQQRAVDPVQRDQPEQQDEVEDATDGHGARIGCLPVRRVQEAAGHVVHSRNDQGCHEKLRQEHRMRVLIPEQQIDVGVGEQDTDQGGVRETAHEEQEQASDGHPEMNARGDETPRDPREQRHDQRRQQDDADLVWPVTHGVVADGFDSLVDRQHQEIHAAEHHEQHRADQKCRQDAKDIAEDGAVGQFEMADDAGSPHPQQISHERGQARREEDPDEFHQPATHLEGGDRHRDSGEVLRDRDPGGGPGPAETHEDHLGDEQQDARKDQDAGNRDCLADLRCIVAEVQEQEHQHVHHDAAEDADQPDAAEILAGHLRMARDLARQVWRQSQEGQHLHDVVERHHQRVFAQEGVGVAGDDDQDR